MDDWGENYPDLERLQKKKKEPSPATYKVENPNITGDLLLACMLLSLEEQKECTEEQEEQVIYCTLIRTSGRRAKRGGKMLLWHRLTTKRPMNWSHNPG